MSRAFIESDQSKHCLFVCRIAAASFHRAGCEKFLPKQLNVTNRIRVCLVFCAFSRLFVNVWKCWCVSVFVCEHAGVVGVHMCVTMIATLHSGKTNTSRDPYIHWQGSFINQTAVHLSTHSIFFPPAWDYKVVSLCQESSRCSAKGGRRVCVRKYVTLESNGWGWEGEEMGRKWSESLRNSGRLTFYETAVLSQVLVLSIYVPPLLSCISHYLVPRDQQQAGVSVSCGGKHSYTQLHS